MKLVNFSIFILLITGWILSYTASSTSASVPCGDNKTEIIEKVEKNTKQEKVIEPYVPKGKVPYQNDYQVNHLQRQAFVYVPSCVNRKDVRVLMYNHGNTGGRKISNFYKGGFAFIKDDLEMMCKEKGQSFVLYAPVLGSNWYNKNDLMKRIETANVSVLMSELQDHLKSKDIVGCDSNIMLSGVANHSGGYRWFRNLNLTLTDLDFVFAADSTYNVAVYSRYAKINYEVPVFLNCTTHTCGRVKQVAESSKNVRSDYLWGHGMRSHYDALKDHFYKVVVQFA